jgi:hypothetical protein
MPALQSIEKMRYSQQYGRRMDVPFRRPYTSSSDQWLYVALRRTASW